MKLHLFLPIALATVTCVLVGALLLAWSTPVRGAPASSPALPPVWGTDIRINATPSTTTTRDIQTNPAIAVNPASPNQALASYDSEAGSAVTSAYAWSTDAGRTWAGGLLAGPWISDTVPSGNTSVGFDAQGTAYLVSSAIGNAAHGYVVLTGTVGAWSTPVPVVLSSAGEAESQAHLAVDPRGSGPYAGALYVTWHYSTDTDQGIWLRYSRDGGRTWSMDIPVSDAGNEAGEQPSLAVAGDGRVYIGFGAEDTDLYLDVSTDGGATWGSDQQITGASITPIGALDPKGRERMLAGGPPDSGFLVTNDPVIAVAPGAPQTVYAAWNDGRWDTAFTLFGHEGQHGDIAFSRSTDGGATWSAPGRVNDDAQGNGVDQWAPNIAIGPDGRIGVTWYDRRVDPDHVLYDRFYSESTDGGNTWSANARLSDASSDPMAVIGVKGDGLMGDYTGFAYGPDYALPTWLDSRAGHVHDIYTDRGAILQPTATAVPSQTATAAPTHTAPAAPTETRTAQPSRTASPVPSGTATPCTIAFSDVHPTDYFYGPVLYLACHGVISGYADGSFRPFANTTRGQLAKMVALGFGWPLLTPPTPTFQDVPPGSPFFAVVETAAARGVISGYSCGGPGEPCPGRYFRPGADVTRGQLAKIVVNAKGWLPSTPPTPTFADVPAASPFFGYIERAVAQGVLSGYACGGAGEPCPGRYFRPANNGTRGQLSKILYNVLISP